MNGVPPCAYRADLSAARPLLAVAVQQRPEPRLRQLDSPAARLLPAAVDDALLRRVLGLGTRPPRDRIRVVLRRPGLRDRPRLVRPRAPNPVRARGLLTAAPPSHVSAGATRPAWLAPCPCARATKPAYTTARASPSSSGRTDPGSISSSTVRRRRSSSRCERQLFRDCGAHRPR